LGCPVLVFGGGVLMFGSSPSLPSSGSSPGPGFLVGTIMLGSVRRNWKSLCFYLVFGTAEVQQSIHDVNVFIAMLFL
jgi:hypothetical protein